MTTTDEKYATMFTPKTTGNFVTNEVVICGNDDTGQIYIRDYSEFALAIQSELGLGNASKRNTGISSGTIPLFGGGIQGSPAILYYNEGSGIHGIQVNGAFNKNFAGSGSASTVARSDHNHDGFAVKINNTHMLTSRFTGSTSKSYTYLQLGGYVNYTLTNTISPAINVSLYELSGSDYVKVSDSVFTVTITTREASTNIISIDTVTIGGLTSSKTYTLCILFKDDGGFNISSGT